MSPDELAPEVRDRMERELQEAQDQSDANIAALPSTLTASERANKITSLTNANATKRSQIRKAYGVSLRLRKFEKAARVAAGLPADPTTRLRESIGEASPSGTPSGTPRGSPPTTSFSPINTPRNNPSPPTNGHSSGPPQPPAQHQPPSHPPYGPRVSHHGDGPLTHINNNAAHSTQSGFGVLRSDRPVHVTPTTYHMQYPSKNIKKRKRGSDATSASSTPGPGLSMVEVSSENADAKFATRAKQSDESADTPMADAPSPDQGSVATQSVIEILSDSEGEDSSEVPIKSVETDEAAGYVVHEEEHAARPSSGHLGRPSGFMAKRGGKH